MPRIVWTFLPAASHSLSVAFSIRLFSDYGTARCALLLTVSRDARHGRHIFRNRPAFCREKVRRNEIDYHFAACPGRRLHCSPHRLKAQGSLILFRPAYARKGKPARGKYYDFCMLLTSYRFFPFFFSLSRGVNPADHSLMLSQRKKVLIAPSVAPKSHCASDP